jgi:hypothetical protein
MVVIFYYKILCRETRKCYIGSTNNFYSRKNKHISDYNLFSKNKINKTPTSSFEIMKNNNYEFIILEEKIFSTLEELNNRYIIERKYIEDSENCINKNIPSQSVSERKRKYYLQNRESIICKVKKYQLKLLSQ